MDACEIQKKNWEDLEVSKEELTNLNECLKKEEFRKLLIEYAEEVTNPENRKLYQDEIIQLERERGVAVTFVNPEPGYVIKTSLDGEKKCFINISKCDSVDKPTSQPSYEDGHRGLQWAIPYTLLSPRDDLDKKKFHCTVFDVVFHSDTLYLASKNPKFREIVNNTAMDGVESNFKVILDRKNMKFPKMTFKGISQSSVIRKKCQIPEKTLDVEPKIYQKIMSSYDEARERHSKSIAPNKLPTRISPVTTYFTAKKIPENLNYTTPKFVIKHQTNLDIQDFRNAMDSRLHAATPKNLVIIIDLPLLRTASDAELDVQERLLTVTSDKPAKYHLELPLPYHVDPDHGDAKFDTNKNKLTVTLPVIRVRDNIQQLFDFKNDSGVDSDLGSPPLELIVENDHFDNNKMIKNCENSSAVGVVDDEDFNSEFCNFDCNYEEPLIHSNILYSLPNFTCTLFDNTLALTVHVKNVDSGSIRCKLLNENSGIHVALSSVGAGFFPVYYALCFKIKKDALSDSITVEPWDNNVVFTIPLNNINDSDRYYVGLNEEFMEAKDLPNQITLTNKLQSLLDEDNSKEEEKNIQVFKNGEQVVINIHPDLDSDDEIAENYENNKGRGDQFRLASESSGDELPSTTGRPCRGILKYCRSSFSRSVSESSIDDTTGLLSSVDLNYDSVQELHSESDCCSLKKTVRFSDVVSRQLFRSNSSILGRRKKNQRKLRKKKQAHERRMSESENSETEDRDKYKVNNREIPKEEEVVADSVKPILNRDKLLSQKSQPEREKAQYQTINSEREFKNDLIFDLDM